jgi:hypothetical protein
LQVWPIAQVTQATPPVPQNVALLPGWQTPVSSQQPLGQVCGPQGPVAWHWPLWAVQVWPVGQVPQLPPQPSGPHCLPWHCGVQTHVPLRHVDFEPGQFTQACPPVPHACSVFPGWQTPLEHVWGEHCRGP